MPTVHKANTIEQTKERYQRSRGVLFAEYRGLKVKQLQALRKDLMAKGGDIHVVKNTLFKIAAGDDAAHLPETLSSGPTAITFIFENETNCAKALVDFAKTNKALILKGGLIGGKVYTDKQVDALSKLPPKDVLIAQVIGAIAAPLSGLVSVIEALYADPIRVIGAVADKMAEASPLPAKTQTEEPTPVEAEVESAAPVASAVTDEVAAPTADEAPAEEAPTETQEQ